MENYKKDFEAFFSVYFSEFYYETIDEISFLKKNCIDFYGLSLNL